MPKYDTDQEQEQHDFEEDIDRIWEMMRWANDVRIRRQFQAYLGRQENLQVRDLVYAAVLPPASNSRKLQLRWSGPLLIKDILNEHMIKVEEIRVTKLRIYVVHWTQLRLAKRHGEKDLNPCFFLPRISSKDAEQLEDALSTVVLPAKVYTDKVEDEFCPISHPQGGTSLLGSTMSSTVQAKSEKSSLQKSIRSEEIIPDLKKINPQEEEDRFQSCQEEQREENKTPKELFPEHFTAETVRD